MVGGDVFFGTATLDNTSASEDVLISGNLEVEGNVYDRRRIRGNSSHVA